MTTGAAVLLSAVGLALVVGLWRLAGDGHFSPRRGGSSSDQPRPISERVERAGTTTSPADVVRRAGGALGERATLLQFSSAFCAPCRTTRRVLADVAGQVEGVSHVEIDAELHLAATRELGVLRTPTTLVLDAAGREVSRASGAPSPQQVLAAVDRAVP